MIRWAHWWSHPFWQTPGQEDRRLLLMACQLFVTCLCALLLTSGRPVLALCGTALLLLLIWRLLDGTVAPHTYGLLRLVTALLNLSGRLSWLLLAALLIFPSLLLATTFPGLLWFAGAVFLAGTVAGALLLFLRPLGGAHLSAAGLGMALACLLRSPLPLAGAAVFLVAVAGAWTRMSRSDLHALVPRLLWRRLEVPTEPDTSSPDAGSPPVETATAFDEPLPTGAFTFPLSTWVACHLDGRTAEDPERLRQELARPVPDGCLPLCRRILAHAIQFQEGPFVRELVQNVLDEAARIAAGPWRRILEIGCRAAGPQLLEIEVADLLGMSFATVVNDLLVPNRTSKSARDWGTIGRFGQGFFTTLREAESVRVRSFRRAPTGGGWELDVLLQPVWQGGTLHDVTVSLSAVRREDSGHEEGTTVIWRGRREGDFVADAWEDIRESLQNIPVEDLHIWLDGERVYEPSSNYARIPTLLGPLRLSAHHIDHEDLLLTKNDLPVARVSRASIEDVFPDAPHNLLEILFAGGMVLDLPPGLPLTRTRNALAAKETFESSLSRDAVRACLLAEAERALRLRPWPAWLNGGVLPHHPSNWIEGSEEAQELGERVASGIATLEDLSRFAGFDLFATRHSALLLALPCIPDRRSGARLRLPQIARASWATLFRAALPRPSRPLHDALFFGKRRGAGLAWWIIFAFIATATALRLACLLLFMVIPFRALGQQIGLWALAPCSIYFLYFLFRLGSHAVSRSFPITTPIGQTLPGRRLCSVWDALGDIARDGAGLLLWRRSGAPKIRPSCHLYQKVSTTRALAGQGGGHLGEISWNAYFMTQDWSVRHLLRYLRAKGGPAAAEALRPWLGSFLLLLTHETVHLLEPEKSLTHDERFYRRQRRLLEKVLSREDDFMALCEREARRTVHWTWSPAWIFLVRRSAKRRRWEWAKEG